MMPQIKRIVQELDQTLSQGSTPEEIELFKKICRRMNQNIENAAARQCG
tara:strand:+ start:4170 stop:4316 length:147 start_codon:yes stop_codon:yes gene_type:complete